MLHIIAMTTQVLVILAIVVVVVVVVIVWYKPRYPGPHNPTEPIYYMKSKGNGQYLQWRTGVWLLTPHPEDGDRVVLKNSGYGNLQIVYDHPSGKVLLPPDDTPPTDGERRVVLGDPASHKLALYYDPDTLSLKFGTTTSQVLAGNANTSPFVYSIKFPDQQWVMEAVKN